VISGQTFGSEWDALADTPAQAANMRVRAELMHGLRALVRDAGCTQSEAARRCGVTQPRMNDLLRGRISRFSLDALVNMAAAAGQQVRVRLERAVREQQRTRRNFLQ
jgi:predicted XRE-type DNA-binding protein